MKIGIIGLGYVGLPIALAFSEKYRVTGYDLDDSRIESLLEGSDRTMQVSRQELQASKLTFTNKPQDLASCQIYIITVPTPVDEQKKPELTVYYWPQKQLELCLRQHINFLIQILIISYPLEQIN